MVWSSEVLARGATPIPRAKPRAPTPRAQPMSLVSEAGAVSVQVGLDGSELATVFSAAPDSTVFAGHYPHFPLLPGVYLIEAALQALEASGAAGHAPSRRLLRVADLRLSSAALPGMAVTLQAQTSGDGGAQQSWQCVFSHGARPLARCTLVIGSEPAAPVVASAGQIERKRAVGALEIMNRLPHRPPILLVDAAEVSADGQFLHSSKFISLNEPSYAALGQPGESDQLAYPAALLIESFVQSCALLMTELRPVQADEVMILGAIRGVDVHGHGAPGERLQHELKLQRLIADTALISGTCRVGERLIAQFTDVLVAIRPVEGMGGKSLRVVAP